MHHILIFVRCTVVLFYHYCIRSAIIHISQNADHRCRLSRAGCCHKNWREEDREKGTPHHAAGGGGPEGWFLRTRVAGEEEEGREVPGARDRGHPYLDDHVVSSPSLQTSRPTSRSLGRQRSSRPKDLMTVRPDQDNRGEKEGEEAPNGPYNYPPIVYWVRIIQFASAGDLEPSSPLIPRAAQPRKIK